MKSDSLLKKAGPYGYILPALLVFAVFLFYPFFKTIYLSLYKTNKMGQAKLFVGLGNYMELFQSESFYNSLAVTLLFVAIVAAGSMALGLLAAVLCNKAFPGIRIFSTAYALPMAIASSSAAMIFKIMLHPSIGIVNKLLGLDINWINDPKYALICVALLTAWLNSGINFLYFSAGLSIRGWGQRDSEIFPADTAGSQPNHVLYHRSEYHPGIPVLWPGEDSDPGRTGGIHKPDCVFHLQGCVF